MNLPEHEPLRFIGTSAESLRLAHEIDAAARSDAKVLITGETGTGKDVVARLIHDRGPRSRARLATINCAGLADTLLESELFGHVRGSFSGAFRDKTGLLEAADQGTVFLDEAGEMSARMQGVLLRFLETGEVQRVGSERAMRRVRVRVVAATNRDLAQAVAAGIFREDLYYRLNVLRIHVPPLRARRDDILVLFSHFAELFSRQYGLDRRPLAREAEELLAAYHWPGNVRELKNVVERLIVKAPGEPIRAVDLPAECRNPEPSSRSGPASRSAAAPPPVARVRHDRLNRLLSRLVHEGESFWSAVHAPFMARDLSRDELRTVVREGLERTGGSYRLMVTLFNMPSSDYKRFLGFLRKHDCQVPFRPYRVVRAPVPATPSATPPDPRQTRMTGRSHAIG